MHLVEVSYDPKYGARPLRRRIQTDLEDPLAELILSGDVKKGSKGRCHDEKRQDRLYFIILKFL